MSTKIQNCEILFLSLSTGVKWRQFKNIDSLISIGNVGLKGEN